MESKNAVYVISLDAVDLNLLPISYKHEHEKVVPLWTKGNLDLRNNEYYEFEVKNKDDPPPLDKKYEIDFITCHICDMEVPQLYLKEHKNSFRHKFNTKVADVALKRLQLYMTRHDSTDSDTQKDPSTYYCQECSIIIDCKDELSHKKSTSHKNSILCDRFFNDFLLLYTNDDKIDVTDTHDIKKERDVTTDNELRVNHKADPSIASAIEKQKHRELDNLPIVSKVDKPKHYKDYIAILNSEKIKKPMSFKLNNNNIEVKTIDGSRLRVSEENFHGFIALGKKFLQCLICKEILKLKQREEHVLSDQHINMLSLPLKDKHGVRQINDSWSHCLVCNVIDDGSHTLFNVEHNENLNNALISDNVNENNEKDTNTNGADSQSKVNKIDIKPKLYNEVLKALPSNHTKIDNTINSRIEIENNIDETKLFNSSNDDTYRKQFCESCNVYISIKKFKKHENTMKHQLNTMSDRHYLLKILDENQLQCKICEETILNHYNDIEKHFTEVDHINKYNKLLNINSIRKIDEKIFYCGICNDSILFKNEYLHIETKYHRMKSNFDVTPVLSMVNVVESEEIDTDVVRAVASVNNMKTDTETVTDDCKTLEPDANVSKSVESDANVSKSVESDPNVSKSVESHANVSESVESDPNVSKNVESDANVSNSVESDANVSESVESDANVSNGVESDANVSNGVESDANVSNSVESDANVSESVESDPNVSKSVESDANVSKSVESDPNVSESVESDPNVSKRVESESKTIDKIEPKENGDDANYYYCGICQVKVPNNVNNIKMHIEGRPHQKNLQTDYVLQKPDSKTEILEPNYKYLIKETANPNVVICQICQVDLTKNNANIITHMQGTNHIMKFNMFIEENRINFFDDKVYCAVCAVEIGLRCEISHCTGRKHIKNLTAPSLNDVENLE